MSIPIDDTEARLALRSIEERRRQVVAEINVPAWYWLALAAGWVVLGVIADYTPSWVDVAATVLFGAGHASIAPRVLSGRRASSQLSVRSELVDRRIPILIIGLLVVMVAVTVVLAVLLHDDGARHPTIWASLVVAASLLGAGPALMAAVRRRREQHHRR
jgi:MFS family permease